MILISLQDIAKEYPTGQVLSGIDWEIKSGEKIAMVGRNGCGKSTLLGIMAGRLEPDRGEVTLGRGVRIAELGQIPDRRIHDTLFRYVLEARQDILELQEQITNLNRKLEQSPDDIELHHKLESLQSDFEHKDGYNLERRVESVLQGLGFSESHWKRPVYQLSGGERTRAELARLLFQPVDLLLLDEPTNHLDIPAVEWLEKFLIDTPIAVVLVSHDRVFLERFAGRVVDIRQGRLEIYDGDYAYFQREKPLRRAREQKAYDLQQAEIERIEDFIVRNIAGQKTKQAQSKRRALGKLERLDRPVGDDHAMKLELESDLRSFRDVMTVRNLSKSIGGRELLSEVNIVCERGDKIGVIGPNGSGKSTLLRCLIGQDEDYKGRVKIGQRVEIGFFDQNLATLSDSGRVINEIWDAYPHFEAGPLRSYLGRFQFTGDDVFKDVANLSGGEKNRLALAKLMLTRANLLVMDEPTNHLDVESREVLEEALASFDGTVIVVSHDRRFLDRFTTKILYVSNGTVSMSLGNYFEWAHRQEEAAAQTVSQKTVSDAAKDWQASKRRRAEEQKRERQIRALEEQIAEAERQLEKLETELASEEIARDWQRLAAMTDERQHKYDELTGLYEQLESIEQSGLNSAEP